MKPWVLVAGDVTPLGGMDRANYALATYLATQRRVHIVTHRAWPALTTNANVTCHPVKRPLGSHVLGRLPLASIGRRVAKAVRREGGRTVVNGANCAFDDINWLHIVHNAYTAPAHGSAARRARIVVQHRLDQMTERRRVRRARLVVCNSLKTARDAARYIGVDPARLRTCYLGVDPSLFPAVTAEERIAARQSLGVSPNAPVVLFVGQLHNSIKNFDTLFAAFGRLCESNDWDAVLLAAGDPGGAYWPARVSAAGLGERVRLLGPRQDVPALLAAADLLVLPSRYDSYGLAAHEAICRGVPALISQHAGASERLSGAVEDFVLNDIENVAAFADRLKQWRADIDSSRARFATLSQQLRSWTWDHMAAEIVRLADEAGDGD